MLAHTHHAHTKPTVVLIHKYDAYYPANEIAETFASIAGVRKFDGTLIRLIEKAGYRVEMQEQRAPAFLAHKAR